MTETNKSPIHSSEQLSQEIIKQHLNDKQVHIDVLESIGSTNDFLATNLKHNKAIQICLAETQTLGRGSLNRRWHSPFGKNIYLSLLFIFNKASNQLSGLSLITSLAVCKAIENFSPLEKKLNVKWPNDILVNQKKLSGNLIEIKTQQKNLCQVIIGVGINVNMQQETGCDIDQPWTSLQLLTNRRHDRNLLCAELINQLIDYLSTFEKETLSYFIKEWQQRDALFNQPVQLLLNRQQYQGMAQGINPQGHLLVKLDNGELKAFCSGETTLIKTNKSILPLSDKSTNQ